METTTKTPSTVKLDINDIIKCSAFGDTGTYVVKGIMQQGFKKQVLLVGDWSEGKSQAPQQCWYDVKSLGEIVVVS